MGGFNETDKAALSLSRLPETLGATFFTFAVTCFGVSVWDFDVEGHGNRVPITCPSVSLLNRLIWETQVPNRTEPMTRCTSHFPKN